MTALDERPTTAEPARPPAGRRAWLVLGSVAAVVGVGLVGLWLVGALASRHRVIESRIDATPIRVIEVEMGDGDLHLTGDPTTTRVDLRFDIHEGLFGAKHTAQVVGDRLEVRAGCRGPFSVHCGVDVTARVPAGVQLIVDSDDGTQAVSDITGAARLTSDNGDIRLRNLSGNLTLTTDNGAVSATGLASPAVALTTDNGTCSLSFATSPESVGTQADNGDVTVMLPDTQVAYALHTSTDNGSVSAPIRTDPTSARHISAQSDNGNIAIRYASS